MKKKLVSLAVALFLCLSLSVPAMAVEKTIYLASVYDGATFDTSVKETPANEGAFCLQGDLTLRGTVGKNYLNMKEEYIVFDSIPVYNSAGPAKIDVLFGDPGSSGYSLSDMPSVGITSSGAVAESYDIHSLRVYLLNYDSKTQTYNEEKADPVFFKGNARVPLTTGEKVMSIQELINNTQPTEGPAILYKGATATLSEPGLYLVHLSTVESDSGCSVVINVTGTGAAPAPDASASTIPAFTDVAANSPFKAAIDWAVEQGITKGLTNTTFGPQNTCTVSHILTFLWRAAGQPGDGVDDWARSKGIEPGNLSTPCTRAKAVEFMWKANGSPKPSKAASFADVPSSAAYADAVSWAVEKGVTKGTSATNFAPNNTCTRGQIVTFLYRAK